MEGNSNLFLSRPGKSIATPENATLLTSSYSFWLGLPLGRMLFGFVTPRIGENFAMYHTSLWQQHYELSSGLFHLFIVS